MAGPLWRGAHGVSGSGHRRAAPHTGPQPRASGSQRGLPSPCPSAGQRRLPPVTMGTHVEAGPWMTTWPWAPELGTGLAHSRCCRDARGVNGGRRMRVAGLAPGKIPRLGLVKGAPLPARGPPPAEGAATSWPPCTFLSAKRRVCGSSESVRNLLRSYAHSTRSTPGARQAGAGPAVSGSWFP